MFFGNLFIYGQNLISSSASNNFHPFTIKNNFREAPDYKEYINRALHYNLDLSLISEQIKNSREELRFTLLTLDGEKTLVLRRVRAISENYTLFTENGIQKSNANSYKFYRGQVENDPNSKVGMAILADEVNLMLFDRNGSFQVRRVDKNENVYAGFYTEDEIEKHPFSCETNPQIRGGDYPNDQNSSTRTGPLECVEIYIEADYSAFSKNGGTLESAEMWVLAVMNQVALFYDEVGIPITVSGIKVYTTEASDPYLAFGDTGALLPFFRDKMNQEGFNGRLAHLFSGRGLGGGIAYLNSLCSNFTNVAVSGNMSSGGTTYSTYTWNIGVVAHELGHNFGSNHTHDCVWNGNNTQIDDCGNVYWYNNGHPEYNGSCYDNDNRILPGNSGTIMSYCHAAGGGSINLNLGFHPQVRDLIYSRYLNSNCSNNEVCAGVPPGNNDCVDAIRLTPTFNCNPLEFDNLYATASGSIPTITCGSANNEKDVWFVVQIPADGILTIETSQLNGGVTDLVMQLYSGECNSLIAESCDDNSGSGDHAKIEVNNIAWANTDIIIRIIEKSGAEGIFGICTFSANLPCNDVADALIDFYLSTGGENWTNKTGWSAGVIGGDCDYCNWYGITCDPNEKITQIYLKSNNLNGTMNSSFAILEKLFYLNLRDNNLSGSLPDIWTSLNLLTYLDLGENNFNGSFPASIDNLTKLGYFKAENNNFSGTLPQKLGNFSSLQVCDLSGNELSGCFPYYYINLCNRESIDFTGNSGLPNNGSMAGFCQDLTGADYDKDGFCFNINDCDDFNGVIYEGARELCDGKDNNCDGSIDEGLDHGPNVWTGPSSGGIWNSANSWDMGHVPLACEDVEVGMDGAAIVFDHTGQLNSLNLTLRSLNIGANTSVSFGTYSNLYIRGGNLINKGTFNLNGYYSFTDLDSTKNGIENSGLLNISANSYLSIKNSGVNGIHNKVGGIINNQGYIEINSNHPTNGNAGLKNEATIHNTGQIYIYGTFKQMELELGPGTTFNNSGINSKLSLGGNFQGEGNRIQGEDKNKKSPH